MTLEQVLDEAKRLPDSDKWRLVRHLLDDLETEKAMTAQEDWASFVNRMYGAIS